MGNKRKWHSLLLVGLVLMLAASVVGCGQTAPAPAPVSEPAIPAHFITYTDKTGLFSISYPPNWEPALSAIEGLEQNMKEIITSIKSDVPLERVSVIFFAGLPTKTGYMPNVNIVVESLPGIVLTHNNMVEAEIKGIKKFIQDYHELSRVKTTIGRREATIVEYEGTFPKLGKGHGLVLLTLVGKTACIVTCTASSSRAFNEWREDFNAIVRSLRILK